MFMFCFCSRHVFIFMFFAVGIEMARADDVDWVLHVDTDEVIYPGGTRDYSLQQTLASVPADVDLLIFPNYESLAESADVEDPFLEVSLFKRNFAHVVSDAYYAMYSTVARGNPNYFTTYGNGKSAARVVDGLRSNGAHRWHNYDRLPQEWSSEQSAVLHYTFNRFADLISRRDRCDCKPTKEDAERCFILPFDRLAFLEASLKTDAELMKFFRERLVWDNKETVIELLRKGLFVRLYEPMLLMRGFLQALEQQSVAQKALHNDDETLQPGPGRIDPPLLLQDETMTLPSQDDRTIKHGVTSDKQLEREIESSEGSQGSNGKVMAAAVKGTDLDGDVAPSRSASADSAESVR